MKTLPSRNFLLSCRAATCALVATFSGALFAQSTAQPHTGTADTSASTGMTGNLKHADRAFVEKAAQSGREEVEIARVAAERSTNADVKKFAQQMVDDHTKVNDQLASLASARGVTLKEKDKGGEKWSRKDAKDFDRAFVKKMVSDHKKDIDLFSKESKNGGDSELVDFARKTLPTLEQHLAAVSELEKTVGK